MGKETRFVLSNLSLLENPLADSTLGDIVHTQILGQDMVVINSEKVAKILCDQRGTIYAGRPKSPLYRM
jgi:hypothetical protein